MAAAADFMGGYIEASRPDMHTAHMFARSDSMH